MAKSPKRTTYGTVCMSAWVKIPIRERVTFNCNCLECCNRSSSVGRIQNFSCSEGQRKENKAYDVTSHPLNEGNSHQLIVHHTTFIARCLLALQLVLVGFIATVVISVAQPAALYTDVDCGTLDETRPTRYRRTVFLVGHISITTAVAAIANLFQQTTKHDEAASDENSGQ